MDDGPSSVLFLLTFGLVFLNGALVFRIFFSKGTAYPSFSTGGRGKQRNKN
ncbi:hypothetical protein SAMN05660706_11963 [Desulfoscipio geothermicus DSM 3669]|uniref:Uncharacterized protein n=1 Tax=Desulfoscipio geothermicus DSM 3669 TaxID=1121426 RepID=A0A1I6DWT5_9FIRM|nr:hypothetical protein SAMN05660706_11963 [Desulfoscipio geothermicus DSM 3669]